MLKDNQKADRNIDRQVNMIKKKERKKEIWRSCDRLIDSNSEIDRRQIEILIGR